MLAGPALLKILIANVGTEVRIRVRVVRVRVDERTKRRNSGKRSAQPFIILRCSVQVVDQINMHHAERFRALVIREPKAGTEVRKRARDVRERADERTKRR